ncbi:MAG: hypothetical protein US67_C0043G0001, partial [Candidatus Woesebacteria bacterium GW2011_GWD1_38_10]
MKKHIFFLLMSLFVFLFVYKSNVEAQICNPSHPSCGGEACVSQRVIDIMQGCNASCQPNWVSQTVECSCFPYCEVVLQGIYCDQSTCTSTYPFGFSASCCLEDGESTTDQCGSSNYPSCSTSGTCSDGKTCRQDESTPELDCKCYCDSINADLKVDIGAGLVDGPVTVHPTQNFTLNWDASSGTDCYLDGAWVYHDGSGTYSLTSSHTYNFHCTRDCGRVTDDWVTVNVLPIPNCGGVTG